MIPSGHPVLTFLYKEFIYQVPKIPHNSFMRQPTGQYFVPYS